MIKNKIKKAIAVPLTMALVVTMLVPFKPAEVKAAGGSAPSITAYATKADLQEEFSLDISSDTVGKIAFGKPESLRNAMNWYIAGKDTSIDGDNVTLFAASCIFDYSEGRVFVMPMEGEGYPTFSYEANTGYGDEAGSIEVNTYHYGISDIRRELNNFASSSYQFNDAEKSVMNKTKIEYYDYKNDKAFTLSDYLYLAEKSNDVSVIMVGGDKNNPIIVSGNYCRDIGNTSWLRTIKRLEGSYEYYYVDGDDREWMSGYSNYTTRKVRPALNINLTTIPFASAVPVGANTSGTIVPDTAMSFRITPDESIGGVYYGDDMVIAASSDANNPVNLIVQGKDATAGDWYYVKAVTEREIITADSIKTAMNLTNDIELKDCGVWVEKATDGVAYASAGLYSDNITLIDVVTLTDFDTQAGKTFDTEVICETLGIPTSASNIEYEVAGEPVTSNIVASNTTYTAKIPLKVLTGSRGLYFFDETVTATVNGNAATVTRVDDYNVIVNYQFTTGEFEYEIVEGNDGNIEKESNIGITFIGNGDVSEFSTIKVDGQIVDRSNYTVLETASSVTLSTGYIDTLSVGTHTFEMIWEGGSARTNFTVKERTIGGEETTGAEGETTTGEEGEATTEAEEDTTEVEEDTTEMEKDTTEAEEDTTEADEEETTAAKDDDLDDFGAEEDAGGGTEDEEVSSEDGNDTVKAPVTGDNVSVITLVVLLIASIVGVLVAKKLKKIEN